MNIDIKLINYVLLVRDLKSAKVSIDALQNFIVEPDKRVVDIGPIAIAEFPGIGGGIYIHREENRIEIKITKIAPNSFDILSDMLNSISEAIPDIQLIAYGINYFSLVTFDDKIDIRTKIINNFKSPDFKLEEHLHGEVIAISPQINYMVGDVNHQLNINSDVQVENKLNVNLNIHFNSTCLPERDSSIELLNSKQKYLYQLIENISK